MGKTYHHYLMTPRNPKKYVGTYPITCRSSWEFKFAKWCDSNDRVVEWSSESVIVPYISPLDNKQHKYFVDNHIKYMKKDGTIARYLIEIKPKRQTVPPVDSKRKRKTSLLYEQATWAVNTAKWAAAKAFAKSKGYEFIILTEDELFIK